MKARNATRELVFFELTRGSMGDNGPWIWCLYVVAGALMTVPNFVLLFRGPREEFAIALEAWQAMLVFGWLGVYATSWAFILVREAWVIVPQANLPAYSVDEFLVTRAVDRRRHFRIRTLIWLVTTVGPLALALGFGLVRPEFAHPGARAAAGQIELWPAGVPTGAMLYSLWTIWAAIAALALAQGYYSLVARYLSGRRPLAASVAALFPVCAGFVTLLLTVPRDISENEFFFLRLFAVFSAHPGVYWALLAVTGVAANRFCEKTMVAREIY